MSISLSFFLSILSVWRITHLLSAEDAPVDMIYYLRRKAGAGFFGSLLNCFYCLSIWIALPFSIGIGKHPGGMFLLWMALSGAACLLERLTGKKDNHSRPPVYFEDESN